MTARLAALGIGQCVNWGVLYYAFAVLVVPLQHEFAVATWTVTGAFSTALLVSAAAAPTVGRWADCGRGPWMMHLGGIAASMLLIAWTLVPGVLMLYLTWAALGLCMAATLYEPVFVIVGRMVADPSTRLRALGTVTLFGGLASTVFLPGTSFLVERVGWRSTVLVLSAVLLLTTAGLWIIVLRRVAACPGEPLVDMAVPAMAAGGADSRRFAFVITSFSLTTLAGAGFTANLVPALAEGGTSPALAATIGGLMGVMQLPGRAWLMQRTVTTLPARLLALSLLLHAAGLVAVAFSPVSFGIAVGAMTFALGSGLATLVRPHLIQTMFNNGGGYLNGRIARYQQLSRAAGPLAIAALAGIGGYAPVFALLAVGFSGLALGSQRLVRPASVPNARRLPE